MKIDEMSGNRQFPSDSEYSEFRQLLSEALSVGQIERVPVMKRSRCLAGEQWFRDKETGEIYSLIQPQERIRGRWAKVNRDSYS